MLKFSLFVGVVLLLGALYRLLEAWRPRERRLWPTTDEELRDRTLWRRPWEQPRLIGVRVVSNTRTAPVTFRTGGVSVTIDPIRPLGRPVEDA